MQIRLKLVLFTTVPVLVALGLVAAAMQHQTLELARQERDLVESVYLHSKETELRHYVQLATTALQQIAADGQSPEAQQARALGVLGGMRFGEDGYFFVYDRHGGVLLDARQIGQPGVDICDPGTPAGAMPAKLILDTARRGGGLVRYPWQKPSLGRTVPKLGFVALVPQWQWTIGTGLYLDDVEDALRRIDEGARQNIRLTRLRIYAIAAVCIVLIGIAGLALNISDHRALSAKLRRLAQRVVHSQEDERLRVARELHDGVVQVLVSSKFTLETAQLQLQAPALRAASPPALGRMLDTGIVRLNDALVEIRRVSRGLRPALLDDLGLAPALALMAEQAQQHCASAVRFAVRGEPRPVPTSQATALFRVAQEALANAQRHAQASRIDIVLRFHGREARLTVRDNGRGFAVRKVQDDRAEGIGLRNMRERIEGLGGRFAIASCRFGTRISAALTIAGAAAEAPPDAAAALDGAGRMAA